MKKKTAEKKVIVLSKGIKLKEIAANGDCCKGGPQKIE